MIYYNSHYLDFSSQCEQENLFSPFYRRLILGIHEIGNSMNALHQKWRERIFENRQQLLSEFHGNHQEILDFLSKE
jgi:hypothetical protein